MPKIEQMELEAHRTQLETEVRDLVDKYLAISEWDIPDINEPLANRLIITAIRQALDRVEKELPKFLEV
ncbi:MAG: hypothetical protein H7238_06125 [Polaromonas sp.]|nr:hypothetical protein [Polaromonas sp.]